MEGLQQLSGHVSWLEAIRQILANQLYRDASQLLNRPLWAAAILEQIQAYELFLLQ